MNPVYTTDLSFKNTGPAQTNRLPLFLCDMVSIVNVVIIFKGGGDYKFYFWLFLCYLMSEISVVIFLTSHLLQI